MMTGTQSGIFHMTTVGMVADDDMRLVARFRAGDESAFADLVAKYRRQVYAVAYRICGNHEEADDLAQDTFVKAYQKLGGFRGEASFKTWLLRITTNLSINLVKSGRISKDSGEAFSEQWSPQEGAAFEGLVLDERRKYLHDAIKRLPEKQRQTLVLKTYQDLTCEEVANMMNCSVGTVKANLFNALKKLKNWIQPA